MAIRLRVLAGPTGAESSPGAERTVEIDDQLAEIRFGRRAGLEIELPFPSLSSIHARLVRAGGGWVVEDLGSTHGSWLDRVPLEPGHPRAIAPGSTLRLAEVSLVFEGTGASSPADAVAVAAVAAVTEGTATIARRLVSDLFRGGAGGDAPRLVGLATTSSPNQSVPPTLRLTVPDRPYLIGRDESCDLILPTTDVSREHAILVRRWEGVHIRDLDSKNGSRVGGQPIQGEHRLRDGDQLAIGSIWFRLDDPEDRYLKQIESAPDAPLVPAASPSAPVINDAVPRPWLTINLPFAVATAVLVAIAAVVIGLLLNG